MLHPGDVHLQPHMIVNPRGGPRALAELGRVRVPMNRRRADATTTLEVAFVRLLGPRPRTAPPLFYLAGGPGGSGISRASVELSTYSRLARERDVVLVDPRGVNFSGPSLENIYRLDFPLDEPLGRDALLAQYRARSLACAARWREAGVDLDGYNAVELADDIDAVRQALGYETIQLLGGSFGSHLGLTYLRRHGAHVEGAVLFGVEGPDHTVKLPSTTERCLEALLALFPRQPDLAARLPHPRTRLQELLEKLEAQPVTEQAPGADAKIILGKLDVQYFLAGALGHEQANRSLAKALISLHEGDYRLVAQASYSLRTGYLTNAMSHAVDCASGCSPERAQVVSGERSTTVLEDYADFPVPYIADAWGVSDLGDDFRSDVISDARTLLVSGSLDGRTPPSNAEEVRRGLSNASHVVITGFGHGHITLIPEMLERVELFLSGGHVADQVMEVPFAFDPPLPPAS